MAKDLSYGYGLLKNNSSLLLEAIRHEKNKETSTHKTTKSAHFHFQTYQKTEVITTNMLLYQMLLRSSKAT